MKPSTAGHRTIQIRRKQPVFEVLLRYNRFSPTLIRDAPKDFALQNTDRNSASSQPYISFKTPGTLKKDEQFLRGSSLKDLLCAVVLWLWVHYTIFNGTRVSRASGISGVGFSSA